MADDTFSILIEADPRGVVRGAQVAQDQLEKLPDKKVIELQLDPNGELGKTFRDIQDQTSAISALAAGRRDLASVIQAENTLRAKGVELSDQERVALTALLGEEDRQRSALANFEAQEAAQKRAAAATEATIVGLHEETAALDLLAAGRRQDAELLEIENNLKSQGVNVDAKLHAQLDQLISTRARARAGVQQNEQAERAEAAILERLHGPLRQYQSDIQSLVSLLNKGAISQSQFNAEVRRAKGDFEGAGGGGRGFLNSLKGNFSNIGEQAASLLPAASVAGGAFAVEQTISKVVELGNEYAGLQNKLRNVTGSEEELTRVQKGLFEISNDTGTAVGDIATIYQRTSNAVSELGISSNRVKGFVDNLAKTIAYSGASSSEASQGLIQLSQGLGKGVLQGQDLKAVLEDVPEIGRQIAAGLGIPFSKLKELGEQGKLTTKEVFEGLERQSDVIGGKFAERIPTAEQALTKLHNTLLQIAGDITKGMGPALNELVDQVAALAQELGPVVAKIVQFAAHASAPAIQGLAKFIVQSVESLTNMEQALEKVNPAMGKFIELAGSANIGSLGTLMERTVNATHNLADAAREAQAEVNKLAKQEEQNSAIAQQYARYDAAMAANRQSHAEDLVRTLQAGGEITKEELAEFVDSVGAATEATKQHEKELDNLLDKITPVRKAQAEYAKVSRDLIELIARGTITQRQATQALDEWRAANEAALDPVGHLAQTVADHIAALQENGEANTRDGLIQKYTNQLRQAGVIVTADLAETISALATSEADAIDAHTKTTKSMKDGASAAKSLWSELFPAEEAARKLAEAQRILESWVKRGKLSIDEATDALERYRQKHEDLLDPVHGFIRAINEEIVATRALTDGQRDELEVQKFVEEQRLKGIHVFQIEIDLIRKKQEELRKAKRAEDFSKGPGGEVSGDIENEVFPDFTALKTRIADSRKELNPLIEAQEKLRQVTLDYNQAVEDGIATDEERAAAIAAAQAEMSRAAEEARKHLLETAAAAGDASAAWELGFIKLKEDILDVSDVSNFMVDTFHGAEKALTETIGHLGDALYDLTTKGKADWKAFGQSVKATALEFTASVLASLEEIILKLALIKIIGSIAPGAGGGAFGKAADMISLFGFAGGGAVTVGGNTGTDQNIFAARVSRNERITFETADQVRERERGGGAGGGGAGNTAIFNVFDQQSMFVDALDTPRGRRVIVNIVRQHPELLKALQR